MKKPALSSILFTLLLAGIYLIIGFHQTMSLRPQSIHQWAQCDRASVALNFAYDSPNILKPQVHNTGNGTGITGMEFPIVNYIVGMLYRVFGFHEWIYRLVMLLIISTGLVAAFRSASLFLKSEFYAAAAVLLLFLSPVVVYYTPNFLPDTAALGLILCSWYFFFKYRLKAEKKIIILLMISLSLACLIKVTHLMSLAVMAAIAIDDHFRTLKQNEKEKRKSQKSFMILLLLPLLFCISWYSYASWLSESNNSTIFLLKYRTILNSAHFFAILEEIQKVWLKQFYSKYMYAYLLISFTVIIIFRKRIEQVIFKIIMLLWTGNLIYFILMMAQFPEHDYYVLSMLPAILFQSIAFFSILQSNHKKVITFISPVLLAALIIHGIWFSRHVFHDRYDPGSWMASNPVYNNYMGLTSELRALGISRNDIVISAYDPSPDISLYLMDQKGITIADAEGIKRIVSANAHKVQYIVVNDNTFMHHAVLQTIKSIKIGQYDQVHIYKISHQ